MFSFCLALYTVFVFYLWCNLYFIYLFIEQS